MTTKRCEECDSENHAEWCSKASVTMTKKEFVDGAEGGVRAAIESYEFMLDYGDSKEGALEIVINEAIESASCFMGIGSCGGGGCKHG